MFNAKFSEEIIPRPTVAHGIHLGFLLLAKLAARVWRVIDLHHQLLFLIKITFIPSNLCLLFAKQDNNHSFCRVVWKWIISVQFWDSIERWNKEEDKGINHFLWKAEFKYCKMYVVLDCFIVSYWGLLFLSMVLRIIVFINGFYQGL